MGKQKELLKTRIKRNETDDDLFSKKTSLIQNYKSVRNFTKTLCRPLATEDYVIQSMPDASPVKWHLAHTTWFFETFILAKAEPDFTGFHPVYNYLFNSYYVQAGERYPRQQRGLISRPTVEEVLNYRDSVDERMLELLDNLPDEKLNEIESVVELGLNHEQQHQELILTDIKHMFSFNPLHPVYSNSETKEIKNIKGMEWIPFSEGLYTIGNEGRGFCFDNEKPLHKVYLNSFKLGSRLVTNSEYMDFISAGGYKTPELWLSDGWYAVQQNGWNAPLYWEKINNNWNTMTLNGFKDVNPSEPVCHISYYEADAYAHWAGARLPSEAEWESAASTVTLQGNFVENGHFHPEPPDDLTNGTELEQMFGDVWEWTQSAYLSYPGFKPLGGALGEYNGKFMVNQHVLRGGSCATSLWHIRKTYRNFFSPAARWQFTGIRLARE